MYQIILIILLILILLILINTNFQFENYLSTSIFDIKDYGGLTNFTFSMRRN